MVTCSLGEASTQELAAQTKSAYLLMAIPEGYSLEIVVSSQIKPVQQRALYLHRFLPRRKANDYLYYPIRV